MAGDEVCLPDQVRRADRPRAEAQVRDGHRARLLRVVDEVALGVVRRLLADDLDRVLVGADRAVRAQAEEHAPRHVVRLDVQVAVVRQRRVRDVVDDADGEVVARRRPAQLVEHAVDHRRRELLRRQAVAAADDASARGAIGLGALRAAPSARPGRAARRARPAPSCDRARRPPGSTPAAPPGSARPRTAGRAAPSARRRARRARAASPPSRAPSRRRAHHARSRARPPGRRSSRTAGSGRPVRAANSSIASCTMPGQRS